MKTKIRYFVPVQTYRGCVKYWQWTKRTGLVCFTRDGFNWESEWTTLRAFLKAVRERRETAVCETSVIPA